MLFILDNELAMQSKDPLAHDLPGLDLIFFAAKGLGLTAREKQQILAFLDALNDEQFVTADSGASK